MRHKTPPFVVIESKQQKGGVFMWKRILAIALVLALAVGITAQAASLRVPRLYPNLTFSGTTATCTASLRTDKASDAISMTVKLWQGTTCLKTWSTSGTGSVSLSKTATVSKGKTYKLTVDSKINGVAQSQQSITRTCP